MILAIAASVPIAAQKGMPASVEQMLSRGITLYATDNASTEAEKLLLQVLKTRPGPTREGETALYYLGRYHHRNYYMLKQPDALTRAVDRYKEIHLRVDSARKASAWYADARLYKGLAYLEQGKWKDAYEAVDHLRPDLDAAVEIDYLVWSLDKKGLNVTVPSTVAKDRYLAVVNRFSIRSRKDGQRDPKATADIIAALQAEFQQTKRSKR